MKNPNVTRNTFATLLVVLANSPAFGGLANMSSQQLASFANQNVAFGNNYANPNVGMQSNNGYVTVTGMLEPQLTPKQLDGLRLVNKLGGDPSRRTATGSSYNAVSYTTPARSPSQITISRYYPANGNRASMPINQTLPVNKALQNQQPYVVRPMPQQPPSFTPNKSAATQEPIFRPLSYYQAQLPQPVSPTEDYTVTTIKGSDYPIGKPTLACVAQAAQRQDVPVDVMLAINSIEQGQIGEMPSKRRGGYYMGAFQINTTQMPRLHTDKSTQFDVLNRGCFNAQIAAVLLSDAIHKNTGKYAYLDRYAKAACYHSWDPVPNAIYRQKLIDYTQQWREWLRDNNLAQYISDF